MTGAGIMKAIIHAKMRELGVKVQTARYAIAAREATTGRGGAAVTLPRAART
jgi:hypothetical protein